MLIKKVLITIFLFSISLYASQEGKKLFKKCAICHGEKGEKRSLNVSQTIAGWKAEKTIEKLKGYKTKEINTYGFGSMMGGQTAKLSDSQMREVAKYIESLPSAKPKEEIKIKKLTPLQEEKNRFFREFFQNNRNGTKEQAVKAWESHLKSLK